MSQFAQWMLAWGASAVIVPPIVCLVVFRLVRGAQ